jgi:hypothetical protein
VNSKDATATLRDISQKAVLGPSKSFIAWDKSSIRWSNLPAGLERAIQSWLGPWGWTQGAPSFVALGADGAYFARSECGAFAWCGPGTWKTLDAEFGALNSQDRLSDVEVSEACRLLDGFQFHTLCVC